MNSTTRPVSSPFRPLIAAKEALGEERSGGLLLITASVIALIWANSPLSEGYFQLQELLLTITLGDWYLQKSLHHWVNDGLMAVFFLLIGLEIKRELTEGSLARPDQAMVTAVAAVGGMLLPALIYFAFNFSGEGLSGWGIPVATDIAFVIGLLGLLGSRIPNELKVFIVAMAVVDDLGAILIIALFYSQDISLSYLAAAFAVLVLTWGYGRRNGQSLLIFLLLGVFVWYFMQQSGVHATIAGVLLAMVIPERSGLSPGTFQRRASVWLRHHAHERDTDKPAAKLRQVVDQAESPASRLEDAIRPWILLFIMPLFALMNAGFTFTSDMQWLSSVSLGVSAGLVLGKPLGVIGACWLLLRLGPGRLPEAISWRSLIGVGLLAGVGFTMSLFIGQLAFGGSELLAQAKIGILSASLIAACAGLLWLRFNLSGNSTDKTPKQ